MKVKFIKDLYASSGHYLSGEVHDLEHEAVVLEDWIKQGYCEAIKQKAKGKSADEAGDKP